MIFSQPPVKADVFSSMGPFPYISPSLWQVLPCPTFYLSFRTQVQLLLTASQVFMPATRTLPFLLWRWSHQWPLCGQIQQKLSTLPSLPATLSWGHSLLRPLSLLKPLSPNYNIPHFFQVSMASWAMQLLWAKESSLKGCSYDPLSTCSQASWGNEGLSPHRGLGSVHHIPQTQKVLKPNSFGPDHSTSNSSWLSLWWSSHHFQTNVPAWLTQFNLHTVMS